mgnify:FL=1
MSLLKKTIKRSAATIAIIYGSLFIVTLAIHYPEPISAIRLGLAPASKTPELMPAHVISPSSNALEIPMGSAEEFNTVTFRGEQMSFEKFLARTHTNAFLIIRNGKLTYQKYLNGKSERTRLPSYSVAKTMTSLLIGQLITQGKIKESDTFVSFYPKFKAGTSFDKVTIKDLLDMNSGIGVSDNYPTGPSGWGVAIAQMYATTDMEWFIKNNRKMREEPGTFAEYRSVNTQLLGMIIQKVTGQRLSDYFSQQVWQVVGAKYEATWNVDKSGGYEKAFCCFNATAMDYGRVGLAVMNQDSRIISSNWYERISAPVVTLDYKWGYSAQVWHPYSGINLMLGLHGQFVYMDKAHDTVIVKLSDEPTSADGESKYVAEVLKSISEKN